MTEGSEIAGRSIAESRITERTGLLVFAIRHGDGRFTYNPAGSTPIPAGSVLVVIADPPASSACAPSPGRPASSSLSKEARPARSLHVVRSMRIACLPAALLTIGIVLAQASPAAAAEPLVVVVRGYGAETDAHGWSSAVPRLWGLGPVHEIRFPYADGRVPRNFAEFSPQATGWARAIQPQLRRAVEAARREQRPLLLVSHSWGSVATAIALSGGGDYGYPVRPLDVPPGSIDRWVTLASPLGAARDALYLAPSTGIPVHLSIPSGRPAAVSAWTNVVHAADTVTVRSRDLPGAENLIVRGGATFYDAGTDLDRSIWVHPDVIRRLQVDHRVLAETGTAIAAPDTALRGETGAVRGETEPSAETPAGRPYWWRSSSDPQGCGRDGFCRDFRTDCPCRAPGNCGETQCVDPRRGAALRPLSRSATPGAETGPPASARPPPADLPAGERVCRTAEDEATCDRYPAGCACRRFGLCGRSGCRRL